MILAGCATAKQATTTGTAGYRPSFWPRSTGLACERYDALLFEGSEPVPEEQFTEAIGCALERTPDDDVPAFLTALGQKFQAEDPEGGRVFRFVEQRLGGGTSFAGMHFSDTPGHWDASARAASDLSEFFSNDARQILKDASQDADLLEWTVMAAHAQTPDQKGVPADVETAKRALAKWLKDHSDWVAANCREKPLEALYRFGYSWHALQDLAPHKGRTNPEHSYNARLGKNPDDVNANYLLAVDLTTRYARAQLAGPLAACVPAFKSLQGSKPSFSDKQRIIGKRRDFTFASLHEYRSSFALHEQAVSQGAQPVRWFSPTTEIVSCDADPSCLSLLELLR